MEIEPIRSPMTPKLIDSLYVEAMMLADQARSYFDSDGRDDRLALDPIARVGFSCESLKVTTRLMHIIAWLLTQRAIDAGELSPAQARVPTRRLGEARRERSRHAAAIARAGAHPRPVEPRSVRADRAARRKAAATRPIIPAPRADC